ncbi:LysM peptidoglycan-binding domain-containing protein [bacterium]|nr:LysM peptidoglycan-binding domain-containing protein [bacterium]MBU1674159.1 LysM peptidoglycan-binding domain-containing protein [bacterium]
MRAKIIISLCLLSICSHLPPAAAQGERTHRVARGETLTAIADEYGVTIQALKDRNGLRGDRIDVGQRLLIPDRDQEWYVVRRGDNLTRIAERHGITVATLRSLNGLRGSRIHPGQKLRLGTSPRDEAVHVVRRGDNLSRIAQRYGTTVQALRRINDLDDDRIFVGQKLRLREVARTVHVVERGDALWEVAQAYGLTVADLMAINGLATDVIHPGQELRLARDETPATAVYTVRRGDNLTEIARLHQMGLRELRNLNGIEGSLIHPGQTLQVRPLLGSRAPTGTASVPSTVAWDDLFVSVSGVRRLEAGNGPYYFEQPRADRQRSKTYREESSISPLVSYRHARQLLDRFDETIASMTPLSRRLEGWHFVLDPGHGGIDPGAIVAGTDAQGDPFHIVEDEIVYDLALRVYALLKLHGAEATLTLLSPNHLLRGSTPVTQTFVHDRNEVFNSLDWNRRDKPSTWPKGGQKYLDARVDIAKRALRDVPGDRQVFLSFHADNDRPTGDAVTLFYYQSSRQTDTLSRSFARKLIPAMGAGAHAKGRALGVLRNNPARYKLLVEMRNLAFADHIWAVRYEQLRQRDAQKVVKALLDALS